jgi:hypothetical protein
MFRIESSFGLRQVAHQSYSLSVTNLLECYEQTSGEELFDGRSKTLAVWGFSFTAKLRVGSADVQLPVATQRSFLYLSLSQ